MIACTIVAGPSAVVVMTYTDHTSVYPVDPDNDCDIPEGSEPLSQATWDSEIEARAGHAQIVQAWSSLNQALARSLN